MPVATRAVVVLNWNNAAITLECIRPLLAAREPSLEVVVVDNGSSAEDRDALRAGSEGAILLENAENLGFARGVNVGLRQCIDNGYASICILNNDARTTVDAVLLGLRQVEDDPSIGLLTGKILRNDGRIWCAGGRLRRAVGSVRPYGSGELDTGQHDVRRDITFGTLALGFVRTTTLAQVGLLCEDYFFGQEEWDFSLRVAQAGYRIVYDPWVTIVHDGLGSHENNDPRFIYNSYRNKITFQRTYLPGPLFRLWRAAFRAYAATVLPWRLRWIHKEPPRAAVARACALRALADADRYGNRVELSQIDAFASDYLAVPAAGAAPNTPAGRR